MARITKVDGTIRVYTETGGAFTLNVVGHGLKSGGGLHALGPYVGTLVADELRKILAKEESEPEVAAEPPKVAPAPRPMPPPQQQPALTSSAPRRKGNGRG